MKTSIRLRMTGLVACTFAIVVFASSVVFLRWFEGQLVDEVRADDRVELDRQQEVLAALESAALSDPDFITDADLLEPLDEDDIPVAIIPDDGTIISIYNADGLLLTDSSESFRAITTPPPAPTDDMDAEDLAEIDLTVAEIQEAVAQAPGLVGQLRTELSSDIVSEYELTLRLLEAAFTEAEAEEANPEMAETLNAALNELFFGFDDRQAAGSGRLIETSREITVAGFAITITAQSRVGTIDAALDDVARTLWFAGPVLVLLAAGLAYLATSSALRPVEALTRRVGAITSAGSGERVTEPDTGDEINHLAVTMNDMLGRLEASALSQRRFVSDVSHELRTPAAVIRAEIEAGLAEADNDWQATGASVLAEQVRLTALVDDLLLLARVDEGGASRRVDVDLDALLQAEATRAWEHPVRTADVAPVRLQGDERQLARLVQNLVANGVRHARSTVELTLRAEGNEAVLWVDDDGSGVPASERERVFERFARLDESRERDLGGSGLGLAIVREVAEAHGGRASITNSPLGGARVEVRLAV